MSLFFVKTLENLSYFQQFRDSLTLGRAQVRQIRRQANRLGLVDVPLTRRRVYSRALARTTCPFAFTTRRLIPTLVKTNRKCITLKAFASPGLGFGNPGKTDPFLQAQR